MLCRPDVYNKSFETSQIIVDKLSPHILIRLNTLESYKEDGHVIIDGVKHLVELKQRQNNLFTKMFTEGGGHFPYSTINVFKSSLSTQKDLHIIYDTDNNYIMCFNPKYTLGNTKQVSGGIDCNAVIIPHDKVYFISLNDGIVYEFNYNTHTYTESELTIFEAILNVVWGRI